MKQSQRGMSESVQWAVLGTAFLMCVLGLIEAGTLLHGRTVAVAAALAGAKAQSAVYATDGRAAAERVASDGGLVGVRVTVREFAGEVAVIVDARVPSLVGWVTPEVHAEATRPLEGQ